MDSSQIKKHLAPSHGGPGHTKALLSKLAVSTNSSCAPQADTNGDMWIANVPHGTAAFNNDSSYKVFRNVKDFGAKGDGQTDDTEAINNAIASGNRCGATCGSSTTTPALVYFPSGTYKVSSALIMYYYTQLVGNALNPPTLLAAPNFQGMAMIDTNPYIYDQSAPSDESNQWYVNQNNFFRQVRNFVFDLTQTPAAATTTAIHWQVAQATSLLNLHFKMSKDPSTKHQGVWMENGSGGFMSDLVFDGGAYGMWVGNQQFLTRNLTFNGCQTAVFVNWNWQWTFKDMNVNNCQVGIDMSSAGVNSSSQVGSVVVMDSTFSNTPIGIKTYGNFPNFNDTSSSLLLDNVKANGVTTLVSDLNGKEIMNSGSVQQWGSGSVYTEQSNPDYQRGNMPNAPVKSGTLLDSNGKFFTRSRPQYETLNATAFASVTAYGAKGDGRTDDTQAIQQAIDANAGCKIVYFPAGTYILSNTVRVPPGSRLTGEAWSVLMAKGTAFQSESNPTPMIQVGQPGDTGSVEFTDIIFSSYVGQVGAVLVEWNIAQDQQGSAGMWDTHFRVGGSTGSGLQYTQCPQPASSNTASTQCSGVHTLMRMGPTASAYLENVWAWTADHDLDEELQRKISVFTGRGILADNSQGPIWFYGVQSEHSVFYQYQLDGAKDILMALVQSETPYFQPLPLAPNPFTASASAPWLDPTFDHCQNGQNTSCNMAWALRADNSSNVYIYGAGLYSFFNNYDQLCLDPENCQQSLVQLGANDQFYLYNLNTKGTTDMVVGGGNNNATNDVWVRGADNRNGFCLTVNAVVIQANSTSS
ncbi:beta-1-3-glucanase [Gongronella butleri]|nr:beta-1-3-glucanase [Gongronella butleri]